MRFNRINKITELVKLIWIFFERKVLNYGLLKHKFFRLIISTIILFFTISLAVIMYRFWTESDSSVMQTTAVLDVYSCTVMMWIFVCFLFIKILFMKTGTFMKFAIQFPVTKREIKIAILVFELSISLIVISFISMSVILSLIFKYGIIFISRIICNVFFMSISFFLILELIYVVIEFIVDILNITKMKSVIMFCVNTALLMMMYFIGYNKLLDSLLFNYIDKKGTSKIVFYAYLMDKYNFLIPLIAFFIFAGTLSFVIVNIPTVGNELTNSYVNFGKSNKKINMLKSYFLNVARNIDSYNYTFITYFIFLFATILKFEKGVYSIIILSINGIYIYIQTDSIRTIQIQKKYKAFCDYLNMIFSQYVFGINSNGCFITLFVWKYKELLIDLSDWIIFNCSLYFYRFNIST